MWAASDIAEWWDKQHEDAKKELDRFVENNPNLFGVLVATATATAMEVGKGTVDLLRFGEGAAEGGVGGFGKDAIRLVGLMGPLGKAAKFVQVGANAKLTRLIVGPGARLAGGFRERSATVASGPIEVVLTNLSANAAMMNETGTFGGGPYILVTAGTLAPGASASVAIQFTNSTNGSITFTPVAYSGAF
jgi:hypothetical protein